MKNLQKLIDLKYKVEIVPDFLKENHTCVMISQKGRRVELYREGECAVSKLIKEVLNETDI